MGNQYISYSLAVLAKENGYDHINTYCYDPECRDRSHLYRWCDEHNCSTEDRMNRLIPAPTQAGLQRWIREKLEIHIEIYCNASGWGWILTKINGTVLKEITDDCFFHTYEEALETGLDEALYYEEIK